MPDPTPIYVVALPQVRQALDQLHRMRIHEHFAGYLCLLRAAAQAKQTSALRPNIRQFWDAFFLVGQPDPRRPYLQPFTSGTLPLILNGSNPAGSYAPRSFRPTSPIARIADWRALKGVTVCDLKTNHEALAIQTLLLESKRVPASVLFCFLYRDYGFNKPLTSEGVRDRLDTDFGFAMTAGEFVGSGLIANDLAELSNQHFEAITADA